MCGRARAATTIGTVPLNIQAGKILSLGANEGGSATYLGLNSFTFGRVEINQRANFDGTSLKLSSFIGLRHERINAFTTSQYGCLFADGKINGNANAGRLGVKIQISGGRNLTFSTTFNWQSNKTYVFTCELTINNEVRAFVDGVLLGSLKLNFLSDEKFNSGGLVIGAYGTSEISAMRVYHYTGKSF